MIQPLIVIVAVAPGLARAQEWAQVKSVTFEVAPAILSSVKKTLQGYVAPKRRQPADWGRFLVQYRSVYVQG